MIKKKVSVRQHFGASLDEDEQRIHDDYEWCTNDNGVRRRYGGKVVAAYRRKIWGAGKNHSTAWAAAQRKRGCPPRNHFAWVAVPEMP